MPKGEKEETYGPFKLGSTNGNASIEKEFSKGEASKANLHVVDQVWYFLTLWIQMKMKKRT